MEYKPEQICSVWGFKRLEIKKIIKSGGLKTLYLLETDRGMFILNGLGPGITKTDFLNYVSALDFLSQKSIRVAPKILKGVDDSLYTKMGNNLVYIVEYIDGRTLSQKPEDEYKLGKTTALLHSFKDYNILSRLRFRETIEKSYDKFADCPDKDLYYKYIDSFPNFDRLNHGFIHTDITPHNAIMKNDGEVILIDFDGAGKGSIYIDAGFPLITQFVRFHSNGEINFDYENARAFYSGYQSVYKMESWDVPLFFWGALFWQLMHMPRYIPGEKNVMFQILDFALQYRENLISVISNSY